MTMSSREQQVAAEELAEQLQQLRETELNCWIDDAWRVVLPLGAEGVITAIAELVQLVVDHWPEQRAKLLQEMQAMQQRLSE
jgi:hypothetical protein